MYPNTPQNELGVHPLVGVQKHHATQQSVLSRLQGLLQLSPQNATQLFNRTVDGNTQEKGMPTATSRKVTLPEGKRLKVRILTWNMHDSLPKGELEELLGKVPSYVDPNAIPGEAIPNLPNDANHPYHLVVVAGQECPTSSGIPMGLAAGFRIDLDRDKSKESEKEQAKFDVKTKDKNKQEDWKVKDEDDLHPDASNGWTAMVEDWLCHGGGPGRWASPTTADVSHPRPLIRQKSAKEPKKGPYQLLVKERLMGIYMAIYIHREMKPFIRGTSKSSVASGLIGGRVGNKGGVGISLDVGGATFLFLNAHLAAHEGKVNHRLANLTKIKTELAIDDFLSKDDPRMLAEDLTDKFDYTFLCGDLNFRLDVSRLHADWLIARREYAQAFEFDQLHHLMKGGTQFNGFQEATIDFPPTFKYDVLRTLKRPKHMSSKTSSNRVDIGDKPDKSSEQCDLDDSCEDGVESASIASMVSSTRSSIDSRGVTEPEENSYLTTSPSTPALVTSASKASTIASAVHKSKSKWFSLLSPSVAASPSKSFFKSKDGSPEPTALAPLTPLTANSSDILSTQPASMQDPPAKVQRKRLIRPPPMILVSSTESQCIFEEGSAMEEKGVYDSSNKKRVPSWCDRILWKTTVIPETVSDDSGYINTHPRPRSRVGRLFVNAFRKSSGRTVLDITPTSQDPHPLPPSPRATAISPLAFDPRWPLVSAHRAGNFPARRAYTTFSPPPTAPLPREYPPRRSTALDPLERHSPGECPQPVTPSRWRFLPAFLSPTQRMALIPDTAHPMIKPVKGDVLCLSYNTLDDRGMRRLEGRSDHRPVIGCYAVHI